MLKLYEEQKHTIYEIQNHLGLSRYTLYGYAKGTKDIGSMQLYLFIELAKFEGLDPVTLYKKIKRYMASDK